MLILAKAAKNKLPSLHQPVAVTAWLNGVRDLYKVPDAVKPAADFVDSLYKWYHSLQPITRQQAWKLESDWQPPSYLLPAFPAEWFQIRRAGPNGIFVFIMALSWIPKQIRMEVQVKVEVLMDDFIWVLGTISKLHLILPKTVKVDAKVNSGLKIKVRIPNIPVEEGAKGSSKTTKTATIDGKENKKRKLADIAAQASKKKAKIG
jgi:hypothetical protein